MPIKPISENSWPEISKIEEEAYTEIPPESAPVLKSKWLASPATCSVYTDNKNEILGYLLSHPWENETPPKLYQKTAINNKSCNLFLHDLAVSRSARGKGIAHYLVEHLIKEAKRLNFKKIVLVAVQGSGDFWAKYGFKEIQGREICHSYGDSAKLMKIELQR